MSGIFGIYKRNDKSIEKEVADTMLKAFSYWNPDEQNVWFDGSIALGHTMLWNTPESKYEHLPLRNDTYVLTMDARIDNRDELVKEIELPDRPLCEIGDSEFILGAYKKWKEECPKYLLGDFAFAIWDEEKQHLFCARDHVGVKQFYYHLSDDLFLFGNDLKGLTKYPNISKKINDEAVANYIVNRQLLSNTLTFFETFKKLPPAHTLIISSLKTEKNCYWRLEDTPKVKLPNTDAYTKKLRRLLEEAVYCRMRSNYPITSHLSGGFDSSAIAVLAARKLKNNDEELLAFNWLRKPIEGDNPENPEWAGSKMVAEREGINHNYVTLTAENVYKYLSKRDIVYGETAPFWYEYPVREATQKHGSRTILSGWGGDEFASYNGRSFYINLFVHRKFVKLFKELKAVAKRRKTIKSMLGFIYFNIFIPLVPRSLYCKMPKSICFNAPFHFVKEEFIDMVKKEDNKPCILSMQAYKTIRKHMLAYWDYSHIQIRIESWNQASIINKLEYSYPLLDKRILELIVNLPPEHLFANAKGRHIFTQATKDLLPIKILLTQKIYEPNRVKHLLVILHKTLRLLIKKEKTTKHTNYINLNKVHSYLNQATSNIDIDRKSIELITDSETMLSILSSNFLENM